MGRRRQRFGRDTMQFSRCVHSSVAYTPPDNFTTAYRLGSIKQIGNVGAAVW